MKRRLEVLVPAGLYKALVKAVKLGLYSSKTEAVLEALRNRLHSLGLLTSSNPAGRPLAEELQPVYILYRDHALAKAARLESLKPVLRVCVGWIAREEPDHIVVVSDRPLNKPPSRQDVVDTGLLLLKSEIIQVRRLKP